MTDKLMTPAEWAALTAESRAAINRYGAEYEAMQKRIAELKEKVRGQNYQRWAQADELRSQLSDAYKRISELEAELSHNAEYEKRIAELETRLATACHIEADDKAGFDWAVLDRIHELEATVNRLRNCHNCANNPGDTPCEYVYNCNDSSHWRPLPQPPEVRE